MKWQSDQVTDSLNSLKLSRSEQARVTAWQLKPAAPVVAQLDLEKMRSRPDCLNDYARPEIKRRDFKAHHSKPTRA